MLKVMEDMKTVIRVISMKEIGLEACLMAEAKRLIAMETPMKDRLCTDRNLVKEYTNLLTERCMKAVFTTTRVTAWEKSAIRTKSATKVSGS